MMKKHINEESIYDLIDDALKPSKKREVLSHINSCEKCKEEYEIYKKMLESIDGDEDFGPSASVRAAVLSHYDSTKKSAPVKTGRIFSMKPVLAMASFAAVIIAAVIFLKTDLFINTDDQLISMNKANGKVKINDSNTTEIQKIKINSTIETGDQGNALLALNSIGQITIHNNSKIKLIKASKDKKTLKYSVVFNLDSGSINSKFNHSGNLFYSFTTPHAAVTSGGTEFKLSVDKEKTELFLKEGHIVLSSIKKNKKITAKTGTIYIVNSKGEIITQSVSKKKKNKFKYRAQWP